MRAQFENILRQKRRRLRPSRKWVNFSPQGKLHLSRKNTIYRAKPSIQIASMIYENDAVVRGVLQIPLVEEMKTKLSCEASSKFH